MMIKHLNMYLSNCYIVSALFLLLLGCSEKPEHYENNQEALPYLGRKQVVEKTVDGQTVQDTVNHKIGEFQFLNQDSSLITHEDVEGKVYVADFFFTTCPTICPIMKTQMLRVHEVFKDHNDFAILSHSIDPEYDNVKVLKDFSERLDIEGGEWHFLTGNKKDIFDMGQKGYMVSAMEDEQEPGGFIHSGAFILIDRYRHIRGVYDGTKAEQVDKLIRDIEILLNEQNEAISIR